MKYLIVTGIFALGVSLGYVIGTQSASDINLNDTIVADKVDATFEEGDGEERNDHNDEDESNHDFMNSDSDSLNSIANDSLAVDYMMPDSSGNVDENDLSISREKMIKMVRLPITFLAEEEEKDTAVKDMLGIEETATTSMYIEFWESPLNFEGYKLSKKKIIVYGLSPQFDYKIYKNETGYYFAYHNVYFKMKETQDFLPFSEVSKGEVFND